MVGARFESVERIVKHVHRVAPRRLVELDDRRQRHAVVREVRDGLARHAHRQAGEELRRPRACGDDHDVAVHVVEGLDASLLDREVSAERVEREIRADDPGVPLPQRDPAFGQRDVELGPLEQPVLDPARLQHVA